MIKQLGDCDCTSEYPYLGEVCQIDGCKSTIPNFSSRFCPRGFQARLAMVENVDEDIRVVD